MRCTALAVAATTAACLSRPEGPQVCSQVVGGHEHTCAIDVKGGVWCWGRGALGATGDHTVAESFVTPTRVPLPAGESAVHLSAGHGFTCALLASGNVVCWGSGTYGQLGDGAASDEGVVQVALVGDTALEIASGGQFSCLRRASDRSVLCWGANGRNQVSPTSVSKLDVPTPIAGSTGAAAIGLGHRSACWLDVAGNPTCWGRSVHGSLGDMNASPYVRVQPAPTTGFAPLLQISGGGEFTCGLEQDGTVRCIGDSRDDELGRELATEDNPTPSDPIVSDATALATGGAFACALDRTGTVSCWGRDSLGQVGMGVMRDQTPVTAVLAGARSIATGSQHACAIVGGNVMCWGSNAFGELGAGDRAAAKSPSTVAGFGAATALAVGERHTCAIVAGVMTCTGSNAAGELGNGMHTSVDMPTMISSGYTGVAVGMSHTCGITTSGAVACWGRGDHGQLGGGTAMSSSSPVLVMALANASAIAVGDVHSCAIADPNQTVYCWGDNSLGQLGFGTTPSTSNAPLATSLTGASQLAAGRDHTCALASGSMFCWGNNSVGQIGNGNTGNTVTTPTVALSGVAQITAGGDHTCAATGPTIKCWGLDGDGELGNGMYIDQNAAISAPAVMGLPPMAAVEVRAGRNFTCGRMVDGSVYCWGTNYRGELGDGVGNLEYPVARQVPGLAGATMLSAGGFSACAKLADGRVQCWGADDWGQLGLGLAAPGALPRPVQGLDCGGS